MTTGYPAILNPAGSVPPSVRPNLVQSSKSSPSGSSRYDCPRGSKTMLIAAAVVSVSLHAALFFGFGRASPKKIAPPPEHSIALTLALPDLKDVEEPEPEPIDEPVSVSDLATLVPMQADLPQIPRPTDFVQAINFASLLEKPDLSNVSISAIPDTFRGGRALVERIQKIFSVAELDRTPEPVLQRSPLYPFALRRDGIEGQVQVQFVVDDNGCVLDPCVVASTHPGFDQAALAAVARWKFRPGVRSGVKVSTRMVVPIIFTLAEATD